VASLPSYASLAGTSCTCVIDDSSASDIDPSDTSVAQGAASGHGELEVTMAGSPELAVDGATRGKCGDVTGRATGR
jgi:hypothetical protein